MLINLTPHPIRIFAVDCPDNVDPQQVEPIAVIPAAMGQKVARIGEISLGTVSHLAIDANEGPLVPVEYVEYCAHGGLGRARKFARPWCLIRPVWRAVGSR